MGEVFPIVAGIVVGLLTSRIAAPLRYVAAAVLTILFGIAATMISGEALESWAFALVDIGLVALAAALTLGVVTLVGRRSAQPR